MANKVRIGDVCTVVSGSTPKTNIDEYWDGDVDWITPAELTDETYIIEESQRKITEEAVQKTGLRSFPKGTVILSSRAPIGKVAIAGKEMYCNQGFKNLICSEKIDNRYLYWYLKGHANYLNTLGRGATFKEISKSIVENIEISLPSLAEQNDCANALKKCWDLMVMQKEQITRLNVLIKSRFVEMFGDVECSKKYPYVTMESFTSVVSGGTPDRKISEYWQDGDIRWVKTTELQNNVIMDTQEKITQLGIDNSSAKIIPSNTVLIAMYGQGKTRGMTGYLATESATNQACACILPSDSVDQMYLWQYMILSYDRLRDLAKGGNQPNLNVGIIKNFSVLMPPLILQKHFSAFVRQINKLKTVSKERLEKTQLLFDSLMQQYFG